MKVRKFLTLSRHLVAAGLVLTGLSNYSASAAAESGSSDSQLAQLIESANYSQQDKEALKTGLSAALPGAATDYVSQKTIDIQVKNSNADFGSALKLAVKLADHLDAKARQFANSEDFRRVDAAKRNTVATYLTDVVEQYRARTFEALLSRYGRPISVPANVPRAIDNADYRGLLDVAVKAALMSYQNDPHAAAFAAKPVEAPKPAVAAAEVSAVEKPASAESPVSAEKPAEVEKPVVVETVAEKPALVEKSAEKAVVIENPAIAEKSVVPGKRYPLAIGDSLALLGRLNRVPPSAIVDANPGLEPMRMHVGQVIVIPTIEWVNAQKSAAQSKETPLLSSK